MISHQTKHAPAMAKADSHIPASPTSTIMTTMHIVRPSGGPTGHNHPPVQSSVHQIVHRTTKRLHDSTLGLNLTRVCLSSVLMVLEVGPLKFPCVLASNAWNSLKTSRRPAPRQDEKHIS